MKKLLLLVLFFATMHMSSIAQTNTLELCAMPRIEGSQVHLDIIANNFTEIASFQFGVAWELDKHNLVEITNVNENLAGYGPSGFSQEMDNVPDNIQLIRTIWFDPAGLFASLTNGSVLFTIILDPTDLNNLGEFGIVADQWFAIEVINGAFEEIDPIINGESCNVVNFTSTSNDELVELEKFELYPNPALKEINLEFAKAEARSISIINATGEIAREEIKNSGARFTIDIENLKSGIYHLHIKSDNSKNILIKSFIKQ